MKGLIFTYSLTYGGAVIALLNPWYGLLAYICFAILRPSYLWHWSVPHGNYSRILGIAMLVGWALHGCGNWRLGRAKAIVVAFAAFCVLTTLSASQAELNPTGAWYYVDLMAKIFLPFLVGITLIDSETKLKQLAWVLVLCQGYLAFEFNVEYYRGANYFYKYGFGGMDNNCNAIALVTATGLAFFLGIDADSWVPRAVALISAVLMLHAIFFFFSRGGMLALGISGLLAFVLIPRQPRHYLALVAILLIAFRLAGPEVRDRFSSIFADPEQRDASASARLEFWSYSWDMMRRNPVLGFGPNNFPAILNRDYKPGAHNQAHSLWIQTGAENGIPAALCLISFFGITVVRLWPFARGRVEQIDPFHTTAARMVVAAIVGYAVAAQFVSLEGLELPYYVILLGAGSLKLTSQIERPGDDIDSLQAEHDSEAEFTESTAHTAVFG